MFDQQAAVKADTDVARLATWVDRLTQTVATD
jgi:hypothetical protein